MDKYLIGNRIRWARDKKNLSQEKLAEIVGLSTTTISHIENGECNPSFYTIAVIAEALGVSLDALIAPEMPDEKKNYLYEINVKLNNMEEWDLEYFNNYIDLWIFTEKNRKKRMLEAYNEKQT